MNSVKIVHVSDMHLDSKIHGIESIKRDIRRHEIKKSFSDIVKYVIEMKADLLLMPGDIFDSDCVQKETIELLKNEFNKIKDVHIFIAPGNHDPGYLKAYSILKDENIPNLTIFDSNIKCVELYDKNVRVYGFGFDSEHITDPVLRGFHAEDDGMINIMVLHGQLCERGSSSDYNPIYIDDIKESGLDYIALGHTHKYSGIMRAGVTHYAYSGTHEGHGFDECGEKGIIAGTVSRKNADLKFVPTCIRKYEHLDVDISGINTFEEVAEKISLLIDDNNLYKISLTGYVSHKFNTQLLKNLINAFYVEINDNTLLDYDLSNLSSEYTLKGIFARKVLEEMSNADEEKNISLKKCADLIIGIFDKGGA